MGRFLFVGGLACLALGLVAMPALAGGDAGLRQEVEQLRQEVQVMRTSMLEKEIDAYLSENDAWAGSQGSGGLGGVTIHATFTTVLQGTLGQGTPSEDILVGDGDVDLHFDFQVTDNLDLFIHLHGNTTGAGSFPQQFGATFVSSGPTAAGATDGIGVNGTVGTDPGEIAIYEGGIRHTIAVGDNKLHHEIGALDPRPRFLQNAFADDENTQFIHNLFDDSSAVLWLTGTNQAALGGTSVTAPSTQVSVGWYMWISFGAEKQFTLSWGFFNGAGQWLNSGQFYFQFHWKGQVSGRDMNLRVMGWYQEFFFGVVGANPDDDETGLGFSWDWMATDKIGVFARIVFNAADINPIENDISLGAVFMGLMESRPDDVIGVALGFLSANDTVTGPIAEDMEIVLEIYYRYMMEDGKLQITPHIIYVMDPAGGKANGIFVEDSLFIIGLRVHVPF